MHSDKDIIKIKQMCFVTLAQYIIMQQHEISNNVVCVTSKASDQPAHTCSLIRAFASRLNILRLFSYWPHPLEFLSLKGGCTCWSESILDKMPYALLEITCGSSYSFSVTICLFLLWLSLYCSLIFSFLFILYIGFCIFNFFFKFHSWITFIKV